MLFCRRQLSFSVTFVPSVAKINRFLRKTLMNVLQCLSCDPNLRKTLSGRIRVYDEPVCEADKSGARRKAFRSKS